jgi:branched-chain amino acid transport system substrate-binding protein
VARMKKGLLGAILASSLAALAGTQAATAQEKPPIKIAHTAPLSGIQALVGQLQSIAVDIGVADINASGGINGSKLVVMHYDDQLKPDQGVLRVREAIRDGAVGIIGPLSGTQWEVASPLVNQLKMPAININANKPGITVRPYALRLANPDDTGMPETMDDFMKHMPNVKKVVVMGDVREASGKAAVDLWLDLAKQHNLQVLDTVTFTSGTTDFSPAVLKVKELHPDAILISILGPDAARLGREFAAQAVRVPILGNSLIWPGTLPQTLTKVIGKDAGFWYTTGYATNEQSTGDPKLYKSFVERYDAEVMKNPVMKQFVPPNVANTMLGWDAVKVMADILRAKGIDGNTPVDKAREALKDGFLELKEYNGLNHIKMRDNGDAYIPTRAVRIDPSKSEWQFLD